MAVRPALPCHRRRPARGSDVTLSVPCYSKRGKVRRPVNPIIAHRSHVHIEMMSAGARAQTSFWEAGR
jgi:hypothetical protein